MPKPYSYDLPQKVIQAIELDGMIKSQAGQVFQKRKYRRLVVRWERQKVYFNSFIDLATIHIWINKILLVG